MRRLRGRLVYDLGILPVCSRNDERMRFSETTRQTRIRLDKPDVVLAGMLNAGDVEDGRLAQRRGDAERRPCPFPVTRYHPC